MMSRLRIRVLVAAIVAVGLAVAVLSAIPDKNSGVDEDTDGPGGMVDETTPGATVESIAKPGAFEDEAGQPGPEEVCAAAAHLERLDPAFAGDATGSREEDLKASIQYATERLAASSNPEHNHVAACWSPTPPNKSST